MKLDKTMLDNLLKQDDKCLWESIVAIAASKGFTLPKAPPPPQDMAKLRGVLSNPDRIDMAQAIRIAKQYRKDAKNG